MGKGDKHSLVNRWRSWVSKTFSSDGELLALPRSMESYVLQADNQPYEDPLLDQYNITTQQMQKVMNTVSILSTLCGYATSTATAFTRKVPASAYRTFYLYGAMWQGFARTASISPDMYSDHQAQGYALQAKIWSGLSVAAGIAVAAHMVRRGDVGTATKIFQSSAGFNSIAMLNSLGALFLIWATTRQSKSDMGYLNNIVQERTGLDEETVGRILKAEVPHVTPDEEWTRSGGVMASGSGSTFGLLAALSGMYLPKNPRLTTALWAVSGLSFGLGLALPLFGAANTPEERKFSDASNEHFLHIKENGMRAMIPWALLTTMGVAVFLRGGGGRYANQLKIHGVDKCDNTLGLTSLVLSVFMTEQNPFMNGEPIYQPFGVRGFYAGICRGESARVTIEDYLKGENKRPYAQQIIAATERELARLEQEGKTPDVGIILKNEDGTIIGMVLRDETGQKIGGVIANALGNILYGNMVADNTFQDKRLAATNGDDKVKHFKVEKHDYPRNHLTDAHQPTSALGRLQQQQEKEMAKQRDIS